MSRRVLRPAPDVPAADLGPNRALFPLAGEETGGRYSLTDFTMAPPPAPGPPAHVHTDADEAVYVIDGTLEMAVGDERLTGAAGSVMLAPRGALHSLANPGPGSARFLVVLSPPGYEGFWREMAELRSRLGGPPDADTVRALQLKYHLETSGEVRRFD
jgi:quercetin dioxygenase-like cupin family protein